MAGSKYKQLFSISSYAYENGIPATVKTIKNEIQQLAAEIKTRRELHEVKKIETADDLLSEIKKNES